MDYNFEIDEDDLMQLDTQESQTNGTIFLVDCRRSLFDQKTISEMSYFEAIIESYISVAKNKALNYSKDTLSLVFLRVIKTTDVIMKNTLVVQNLESTSVESIHKMIQLRSLTENQFSEQYGFSDEVSLFHGLWCCQHLFGNSKLKYGSKQILFFTDDDDPTRGDEELKKSILVKGRDLNQTGIHLELIPISGKSGFTVDRFYKTLLLTNLSSDNEDALSINDPVSVIQELMTRIRHKQYKKRKLATLKWQLGSDQLVIGVSVYNLTQKTPPPASVKLDRSTNIEVTTKTATFLKGTDQRLMPFDMKCCLTIAGKLVCFEKEEITKMHSIIEPGIRLLGFKPMKYLKRYYQIRASQFIYPDESVVVGSTNLFSALLLRCSERKVFALCVYVLMKASVLRFVALVPQLEKLDKSSALQVRPPGFHVIFLPFADDIRQLELPLSSPVSETDKDVSRKLIKTLSIEYDPESILNPSLQKKLIYIEAMALDSEKVDRFEDHTVIDCDELNQHCGEFLRQFKEHFRLDVQSTKTDAADKEPEHLEHLYKTGKLNTLTVPVLKTVAKNHKIKLSSTRKGDIISSINAHFDKGNV